ncbi:MAG TPA: DEAD/DEAH box helicase, partial [Verrucomicrobiae bacterium]|nr:DEAD/DEAH box helicase [Verrucomicrobiae bacterium]
MKLNDLCSWALSQEGWAEDIEKISRSLVIRDFPAIISLPLDLNNLKPDWSKLLLIASILAKSDERIHLEKALLIAQAGILISDNVLVSNSSVIVLNQLFNHRTVSDAVKKGLIPQGYLSNLGVSARILAFREEIESKVFSATTEPITANKFQIDFWSSVEKNDWVYALAPTASGKSFIVLKHILEQIALKKSRVVVYIAPTRALVSEIEQNFRNISISQGLNISVSSVPVKDLIDAGAPCIYVFTQERLHIFLNTLTSTFAIDTLVVDEVQKLSDGMRGVILQDAIERVFRLNNDVKILFLSPNAQNPEYLFRDKPQTVKSKIIDRDQPMVSQNIIWATQRGPESFNWKLELNVDDTISFLGDFDLPDRPTSIAKKMALVAFVLGAKSTGNMVYANEPSEAEDIAEFIAELMNQSPSEELKSLSDLARDGIHRNFKLVNTVKSGVAFHYGNMPSLLREEIERLFNKGEIRFLVCTSTLIEGVNLSCKTIFIHGPKKGR